MIKIKKQRFNGSDVMREASEYYYIFQHLLNTTNYLVSIVDNEGNIRNTGNIFTKTEMDVKITVPNDSIGTWEVSVYYEDNSQQDLTKKRLFEQDLIPLNDIPNYLDYNVAVGRPSSSTVNMKLADLKSFCQSAQGSSIYLLKSNNLGDLLSPSEARQHLNVYDRQYVNGYLSNFIPRTGFISSVSSFTPEGSTWNTPVVSTVKNANGVNVYVDVKLFNGEGDTTQGINLGYLDVMPISGATLAATATSAVMFTYFTTLNVLTTNQNYTNGQMKVTASDIPGGGLRFTFYAYVQRPSGQTQTANCQASIFIPIQIN
jgi:hypothetical protein